MTKTEAERYRLIIEQAVKSLGDADASTVASLFPKLNENSSLIPAGTRINWNGVIKRAAVDLWDTAENNPDSAPALWEDLDYREGYRIIPETITVGTAFSNGEYGWWNDVLYKSLINANVYTPAAYPAGWEVVD